MFELTVRPRRTRSTAKSIVHCGLFMASFRKNRASTKAHEHRARYVQHEKQKLPGIHHQTVHEILP